MLASSALFFGACKNDDVEPEYIGNWYRTGLSDFEGIARRSAVGFTIGEFGYAGLGYSANQERLKDFWEYNPDDKFWTQKAAFGGTARQDAVAFSIGNKGYVGTGYDGDYKNDFWEFDKDANKWKQVASLPSTSGSSARQQAVGFVLGQKAYVGLGFDGNYKQDFYEFTPDDKGGSWKQTTSFIGGKRQGASAFVIGDKAYVGFGRGNTAVNHNDLYEFTPGTGQPWVAKAKLTEHPRTNAVAVTLNNKGYIIGGSSPAPIKDVWEYDPATDVWTRKTDFEGGARTFAFGFTLKNVIYYGTGGTGSLLDDFWGFDPAATQVDED